MQFSALIITLALIAGQIIKIPIGTGSGASFIDVLIVVLCLTGLLKIRLKLTKPDLFIYSGLAFTIIAVISLTLTPLHLLPKEYFSAFLYTIRFFSYILLGWLLKSNAFPFITTGIEKILLFSGVFLGAIGLLQFVILPDLRFLSQFGWDPHFYRTVSAFLDPNFLAAYLVLTLLVIFQNELDLKTVQRNVLFTLVYLTLMTTFSRSGYLMFLISFLCISFFKKSLKIALFSFVLFTGLLFFFQLYIKGVNQLTPLDRNQTAGYRFTTWQQGEDIFLKSPVLGVGFNAYNFALREYKLGTEQFVNGHGATTNDSSLLYVASTTGTFGLIAYGFFLFALIREHKKKPILAAGTLGLIANSIFINSLFYPFIITWLILYASKEYENKNK